LQDHERAVVVGERSYGKGSVQNVIPMEKGQSALKLTTASYWRPSGKNIDRHPDSKETDEWGVQPNKGFEVKLTPEQRVEFVRWRNDRDVVRDRKKPAKDPKKGEENKKPFTDEVLKKAADHLKEQIKKAEGDVPLHERARA
jgi:carboxyl-terminal processing protease